MHFLVIKEVKFADYIAEIPRQAAHAVSLHENFFQKRLRLDSNPRRTNVSLI